MTKKITPQEYDQKKKDYEDALKARREEFIRLRKEGKTMQQIADLFAIDIALVSRILKGKRG